MPDLPTVLQHVQKNGVAVGHLNIADFIMLRAIFESAHTFKVPVTLGVSEGERRIVGVRQASSLVRSLREEFKFLDRSERRPYALARECRVKSAISVLVRRFTTRLPIC